MAYVDRPSGTKRAVSLASAAILQGAVGAVLVYGLAADYILAPKDQHLITTTFRDPPPPPQDIPKSQPSASSKPRDSFIDTVPPKFDTIPTGPTVDTGPKVDQTPFVTPVPPPTFEPITPARQLFTAKGPRPANSQSQWVTSDDYLPSDIRGEHTGTARYRVVVGTNGKVASCEIVKSSGWAGLDKATCDKVSRRAKFEPGTDETGAKVVGTYSGSVTWQIPR